MKNKRITIKDIAKALQISSSTVSRALSDHPDISNATKNLVIETAKLLNYTPNLQAKYLRTNTTGTIALILPEFNMFFTPSLLNGINEIVEEKNHSLLILQSDNSLEKEMELIQFCHRLFVDGVLLCLSDKTLDLKHLDSLHHSNTPVVLVDKLIEDQRFTQVSIDGEKAAYIAIEHLIKNGYKRIVGVFGNTNLQMTKLREKGFRKAIVSGGLEMDSFQIVEVSDINCFNAILEPILDQYPQSTAFFTMSDELMVKLHYLLSKKGLKISNELALISISDGIAPYYLYPQITHVLHSGYAVGNRAATCLFQQIEGIDNLLLKESIEIKLIVLNS